VSDLLSRAEAHDYKTLFIDDLRWEAPNHPPVTWTDPDTDITYTATNVAAVRGLRVWVCPVRPGTKVEAKIDHAIAATTTDRLVIFHDDHTQTWRWPSRSTRNGGVTSRPARHTHVTGETDSGFAAKLDAISLPADRILDVVTVLGRVRDAFDVETRNETRRASRLMARMYTAIERRYPAGSDPRVRDHEISVTMARVLFLLFGDDTEMWATEQFQDWVKDHTARDGSDIGERINALFEVLDLPVSRRPQGLSPDLADFRHVNGGLFAEAISLPTLDSEFRDAVLDACAVDWSTISPAIFGSMFQSVRDAETRRQLGEHYTSEENILRTLKPLFLDDLQAAYADAFGRDTKQKKINALRKLWDRLARIRFMDPACGCGNFIIVTYRELRELEMQVMEALADLGADNQLRVDATMELRVTLDHFYGIEVDEWPARIASTAMFLINRQSDLKLRDRFGEAPDRLPIHEEAQITVGNALRLDWAELLPPESGEVIIAGNPPFLGHATRNAIQADDLRAVWCRDDISRLDYVTGWYAKALDYFGGRDGLWAFVSTNSVTQGDPVPLLFGPVFNAGWRIKFAHRTFGWTSEAARAATVACVIVGFARDVTQARLFDYIAEAVEETQAANINGYLVDGPNLFATKRMSPLNPDLPVATFGAMPRDEGNLVVELADLPAVRADQAAAPFLRRFVGGEELVNGRERWCLWLTSATPADIAASPLLTERVENVRAFRKRSTAASTRQMASTPHLFGQRPPEQSTPFVCIPRVTSEKRPYLTAARLPADWIASDQAFTAPDPDGLLFAVISSAIFMAWQRTIGGRLESRIRFSSTIVWNNLPLPALSSSVRAELIEAGKQIEAARDPARTLAQQYTPGQMSASLLAAHEALDEVADRAFGAPELCETEADRLAILFDRFAELTAAQTVS
jgi:hypothetical protein